MKICSCYESFTVDNYPTDYERGYYSALGKIPPKTKTIHRCNGTKEQELCTCTGNRAKCDFYSFDKEDYQLSKKQLLSRIGDILDKDITVELKQSEISKLIADNN